MLTAKQFSKISTLVTMAGVLALSASSGAWAQCGTLLDGDGVATADPVYFECNDGNTPFEFFPLTQGTWTNVIRIGATARHRNFLRFGTTSMPSATPTPTKSTGPTI